MIHNDGITRHPLFFWGGGYLIQQIVIRYAIACEICMVCTYFQNLANFDEHEKNTLNPQSV